jgi:hypothetical protein
MGEMTFGGFAWPQGKYGAVTTSWDDGTIYDRRLVQILNQHGIKATWNLNSGKLGLTADETGWKSYVSASEVKDLYTGHEVACHTTNHPVLYRLPEDAVFSEVIEDRRNLERLVAYPVRGLALPFGGPYNARMMAVLQAAGFLYVRVIKEQMTFELPDNFLEWSVTCHHNADVLKLWRRFRSRGPNKLFHLWGHSYEFEEDGNWERIETFAKLVVADDDVWHATNMEVYEYVSAWRSLRCSLEMTSVKNCSAVKLWFRVGSELWSIGPGEVAVL